MPPRGEFCSVGTLEDPKPLLYYTASLRLLIEKIDRRNRKLRRLVMLVDADRRPLILPAGCRFQHVVSWEAKREYIGRAAMLLDALPPEKIDHQSPLLEAALDSVEDGANYTEWNDGQQKARKP